MDFIRGFWRICRSDISALVGGLVVFAYIVIAVAGPYFVHLSNVQNPALAYLAPSWTHPLGTDFLGQDVLKEIILGTRPVIEVGILAASFAVLIGVVVGLLAGYWGGVADGVLMRFADIFLTIPSLPLIIAFASIVQTSSPSVLAGIIAATSWAGFARAVRSQAMSLRTTDFVEAAKVQGLPLRNILGRQLLPNIGAYVAINFLLTVTGAIYAEVGLFLLGVVPMSGTNWGIMINLAMSNGALYTSKSMLYLFSPMAAIVLLQVALVYFARAFDRLFNPRLRVQ